MKVELSRRLTYIKLKTLPFLQTLDLSFFVRLFLFFGTIYFASSMLNHSKDHLVMVKEEGKHSANKFSKTFGQETRLDAILENIRDEENNK